LSEYTPVAWSVSVVPRAMVGAAGVIPIDTKCAAVTVKVVVPAMPAAAAVMVVGPDDKPVAVPLPLIEAMAVCDEVQVTLDEIFCLEPSLKTPVAVNCCVNPAARLVSGGLREIDSSRCAAETL
jgi:hypothetical protein